MLMSISLLRVHVELLGLHHVSHVYESYTACAKCTNGAHNITNALATYVYIVKS